MGATIGALALLLLASNGNGSWSEGDYLLGVLLLPGVGAAIAAASLLLAQRASDKPADDDALTAFDRSGDPTPALGAGGAFVAARTDARERVRDRLG